MATPDKALNIRPAVTARAVEQCLERVWIAAEGAGLRKEERRKALLLVSILTEMSRVLARGRTRGELTLVDAAAGKAYVGLLAAELILAPAGGPARVWTIERDARRVASSRLAAARLVAPGIDFVFHTGSVGDAAAWPERPTVVVALHACGGATDEVIDRAVAAQARHVLLMPCCTGRSARGAALAERAAETTGIPRQAGVRRAFVEAWIAAERTLRLEAAGYQTEVVPLAPPAVTAYGLLFRARRVAEPRRSARAAESLARLLAPTGAYSPGDDAPPGAGATS